jgi:hypothetical protein
MSPGVGVALMGLVAVLMVAAGLALKRYALILISSAMITVDYLGTVLSGDRELLVWNAVVAGLMLFLIVELGYDATTCIRSKIPWGAYSRRAKYLTGILAVSAASVFIFVTLSYNIRSRFPAFEGSNFAIPALYIGLAGFSATIIIAFKRKKRRTGLRDSEGE